MNPGSAQDYIATLRLMLDGLKFTRTINVFATDYYLTGIYNDYGPKSLAKAISAVEKHIEYYEKLRHEKKHPVNLKKVRDVIKRHSKLLSEPKNLEEYEKSFFEEVKKSLGDSKEARRKRLETANKIPKKVIRSCEVFERNSDVVAEVLTRANGHCERCKKFAPFMRRKDKDPYLEVHHTVRLADGGEDTMENSVALCPNCHRELHFGV